MYKSEFKCFSVKKNKNDEWIIDEWDLGEMPKQSAWKIDNE